MTTAFDRIADSFIESSKEVKELFPQKPWLAKPKPPPRTPFTDYYRKKQGEEPQQEISRLPDVTGLGSGERRKVADEWYQKEQGRIFQDYKDIADWRQKGWQERGQANPERVNAFLQEKSLAWDTYQTLLPGFEQSVAAKAVPFLMQGLEQTSTAVGSLLTQPFRPRVTEPIKAWERIPMAEYLPGGRQYEAYKQWREKGRVPAIPVGIPNWKQLGAWLKPLLRDNPILRAMKVDVDAWDEPDEYEMAQMGMAETAEFVPWLFIGAGRAAKTTLEKAGNITAAQIKKGKPAEEALNIAFNKLAKKGQMPKYPVGKIAAEAEVPAVAKPALVARPPTPAPVVEATPIPLEMPATQRVFSRISLEQPAPALSERLQQGWHKFSRSMLDDLHPLDQFVKVAKKGGADLQLEENPYIWARLLRGNVSKANVMLDRGTFGKQFWKMERGRAVPNFKGPGLEQILEPVREPTAWRDFSTYLTSKRSVELAARKIKTGITKKDALAAIRELEAKYADFPKLADGVYTYQNHLLEYAQEMGLLNKTLVAKLQTYKAYVPFHRVFENLQAKGFMGKKMADIAPPIRRIKGSERLIVNPLESIVKNTYLLTSAADRNQVGIMMANMVKKNPELAALFHRVPIPKTRVARVTAKELGIELEGLSLTENEGVLNIFRPSFFTKDNQVCVLVNGKRQFYQCDADLYRGLLALDRESMGMVGQVLSMPAKWLRAGATLSPDFMVRNPARDQLTAFAYSNYGFLPGIDFMKGVASIFKKDADYQLYRMSGAERAMLVSMDRRYLQKSFTEIVEGKGFKDYVKHPLELLQIGSELGEKATRLGEFRLGVRRGVSPLAAGFSSREVSLDFAKMGTTARAVNTITAFFNANIRGWTRMINSFRDQPVRTSFKVFTGITLPSILLYYANRNDPRWDEIPQWQKDLFWIVMTKDNIYRIPKPFELGIIFGSIPERFLEFLDQKDPDMLLESMRNALEAGSPGFIPTAILPLIENITNYSFFRERPIVPESRKAMPPELQYGGYTSETAKLIGDWVNYSPAKIDNLMNGYTGGLGRYATNVLDAILKGTGVSSDIPEPSPTLAEAPVIKAFVVRDPYGSSSESVDKFYKRLEEYQRHEKYLKEMLKLGEQEKFEAYKAKHPEVLLFYDDQYKDHYSASARYLRRVARQLSEIRKKQSEIYNSRTLTPEQKRQMIDDTNKLLTEICRKALEGLESPANMQRELTAETGGLATYTWADIKGVLGSSLLKALDRLWYKGGSLTADEITKLREIHWKYPLGQKNFDAWVKQTLRQFFENANR